MSWYIYLTNKLQNKKICQEFFWKRFIDACMPIFESYNTSRAFINYVWKPDIKPDFSDLSAMEDGYIYYCTKENIQPNFEPKKKFILKQYNKYLDYKSYGCKFSKNKINFGKEKKDILIIPKYDLSIRRKWGYKWTAKEEVYSTLKHYILHDMTAGNQWTMIDTSTMLDFIKTGHNIEVFGSPFNTRLRYFGSLYDCDEPFGRIGKYQDILDKVEAGEAVMWRDEIIIPASKPNKLDLEPIKLLICPPSGDLLLTDLCNRCIRILKIRPAILIMNTPAYTDKYLNMLKQSKYFVSSRILDKSWDFYALQTHKLYTALKVKNKETVYSDKKFEKSRIAGLTEIDMKGREWYLIVLES